MDKEKIEVEYLGWNIRYVPRQNEWVTTNKATRKKKYGSLNGLKNFIWNLENLSPLFEGRKIINLEFRPQMWYCADRIAYIDGCIHTERYPLIIGQGGYPFYLSTDVPRPLVTKMRRLMKELEKCNKKLMKIKTLQQRVDEARDKLNGQTKS